MDLKLAIRVVKKNVLVAFVDNLAEEIDDLLENDRWVFGNLQASERREIADQSGPTRAWHVSKQGNADGLELIWAESRVISGLYTLEDNSTVQGSRIRSSRTELMQASVVLIERSAVGGKTVRQLTDFATMRAISPVEIPQEDNVGSIETILSLFDSSAEPSEFTEFDVAFLKAYYAANGRSLFLSSTISSVGKEFLRTTEELKENKAADQSD